jgi:hypothetical protein|tara:strand:- start:35 stop:487 length:453 start_codon:yes stop_codon:yes gene_type:complete
MSSELFDIPDDETVTVISDYKSSDEEPTEPTEQAKPVKVKRTRKPLDDSQREALLERLKMGRETARKNRANKKKLIEQERSETLNTLQEIKNEMKERKSVKEEYNANAKKKVTFNSQSEKLPTIKENVAVAPVPVIKTQFVGYNPKWWMR